LSVKYSMMQKFIIQTLIDITNTGLHRGTDRKKVNQQQNFNTTINTIGLRLNCMPISVTNKKQSITNLGFGSLYKGSQMVWTFEFGTEFYGGLTIDMLEQDFHLIPVITRLNETIKINTSVLDTSGNATRNITFKCVDNDSPESY